MMARISEIPNFYTELYKIETIGLKNMNLNDKRLKKLRRMLGMKEEANHRTYMDKKAVKRLIEQNNKTVWEVSIDIGQDREWLYQLTYRGYTSFENYELLADYFNVEVAEIIKVGG